MTRTLSKRSIGTYTTEERRAMQKKVYDKATSSKEEAVKFLKEAGILDNKGELAEHYRSSNNGKR